MSGHRDCGPSAWWFYCADHMYGRWVEGNEVMAWRLVKDEWDRQRPYEREGSRHALRPRREQALAATLILLAVVLAVFKVSGILTASWPVVLTPIWLLALWLGAVLFAVANVGLTWVRQGYRNESAGECAAGQLAGGDDRNPLQHEGPRHPLRPRLEQALIVTLLFMALVLAVLKASGIVTASWLVVLTPVWLVLLWLGAVAVAIAVVLLTWLRQEHENEKAKVRELAAGRQQAGRDDGVVPAPEEHAPTRQAHDPPVTPLRATYRVRRLEPSGSGSRTAVDERGTTAPAPTRAVWIVCRESELCGQRSCADCADLICHCPTPEAAELIRGALLEVA